MGGGAAAHPRKLEAQPQNEHGGTGRADGWVAGRACCCCWLLCTRRWVMAAWGRFWGGPGLPRGSRRLPAGGCTSNHAASWWPMPTRPPCCLLPFLCRAHPHDQHAAQPEPAAQHSARRRPLRRAPRHRQLNRHGAAAGEAPEAPFAARSARIPTHLHTPAPAPACGWSVPMGPAGSPEADRPPFCCLARACLPAAGHLLCALPV